MSKVLFFSIPLQGHTNPSLPLVKELIRRGEEVAYYSLEPLHSAIEDTGATFRSYGASYELLPPPDNAFDGMSRVIIRRSPKILAQLLPEVRDFQPDYFLHDALALWGKQFGQILGVPSITASRCWLFRRRRINSMWPNA
jgi:UDP:flavonoid glycosyltransferase YjiC (YdhE family)